MLLNYGRVAPVRTCLFICVLAALALIPHGASAGNFGVSPVHVELPARGKSASLTIINNDEDSALIQVRLYSWSKKDGHDDLAPTNELVLTPQVFTLGGKGTQTVRVGRPPSMAVPNIERGYRLVLEEVDTPELQAKAPQGASIRSLLKISLPVFVPPAKPERKLDWQLVKNAGDEVVLTANNDGSVHQQIASMKIVDSKGEAGTAGMFYTLPGAASTVSIPLKRTTAQDGSLRLVYTSESVAYSVPLVPQRTTAAVVPADQSLAP